MNSKDRIHSQDFWILDLDVKFDNTEFSVSGQFPELTHGCSSWMLLMAFPKECGMVWEQRSYVFALPLLDVYLYYCHIRNFIAWSTCEGAESLF